MKNFRQFLFKGNVIDLAVAVVIGAAFGAVVTSFVKDLLTPVIGAIGGQPDFSGLFFTVNGSRFNYGNFVNSLLSFILVGAGVYFFVVVPMSRMNARYKQQETATKPATRKCPECFSDIPSEATRCAYCTTDLKGSDKFLKTG
ncbi:MAG TPA: large conductance mechanosensitive channel protein MscL [Bdellovibrionales bacterium]|nr:MAG: mechanosensitive ion channel protein MscL [Bdellovibrionales bacterium GWB1_52_6]OFZ04113.1 MAG: mechanosensitive ion channel protein MscL [Bdellovibrionales bacterium GWA1_52_35]OFZ36953.1 MAG: mechanosensitive ion channel protein MscL [Bdellovibrionales bacterium GWC1_52_8]HAR42175.1 large conductance mechanosensitive channel protein MscL [Bdellovibrionales bacterium]HCM39799.1 large conductance mechanosensitive channel protein MscL [Bdellovibrionales bacterium]